MGWTRIPVRGLGGGDMKARRVRIKKYEDKASELAVMTETPSAADCCITPPYAVETPDVATPDDFTPGPDCGCWHAAPSTLVLYANTKCGEGSFVLSLTDTCRWTYGGGDWWCVIKDGWDVYVECSNATGSCPEAVQAECSMSKVSNCPYGAYSSADGSAVVG